MTNLFKNISILNGVGKKRKELYEKINIDTPFDLLYYFPRNYINYSKPIPIADLSLNDTNVVKAKIVKKLPEQFIRKGLVIYKAIAEDFSGEITIVIYNNNFAFDKLNENDEYYFYGKTMGNIWRKELVSPNILDVNSESLILPIYPLISGLTSTMIQTNVKEALNILDKEKFEVLPEKIILKYNLNDMICALKNIHFPEDELKLEMAKKRLAFDELLTLQLGMKMFKVRNHSQTGSIMNKNISIDEFSENLPFTMTTAQKNAINEICTDLCNEVPMNRLLQGDVGSGKTVVAAASMYFSFKNGYQSALMAPTEILAIQHYNTLMNFFKNFDMKICLLTGSIANSKKKQITKSIENGEYDIIVGTHAIIQKNVQFKNLGLVITDEQHRFGVSQRASLAQKANFPHKLIMSATPIPRTLALIIYGDLEITILKEMPHGRKPIETYAVTGKLRERIYKFIKSKIDEGSQAYIVCPMIEENENDINSVLSYAQNIENGFFKDYKIGVLHGQMNSVEKNLIMQNFKENNLNILVSTTVIEVGVDVPNAVVMMVESSDRFGLSQLHQLRGRVGRGDKSSYCVLVTDNPSEETTKRLKIMSTMLDGFEIAEQDLKLRGPGDFFGNKQHGLPKLKIADLLNDIEMINLTKELSGEIINMDENLMSEENKGLRFEVQRLFSKVSEESYN